MDLEEGLKAGEPGRSSSSSFHLHLNINEIVAVLCNV